MGIPKSEVIPLLSPRVKIVVAEYETEHQTKISRKEWAAELGITPQYLSAILGGRKIPEAEIMFKMAKRLGRPVEDLWRLEE